MTALGREHRRLSIELACVPVAFALHNAEEALTVGEHLPRLRDAIGAWSIPVAFPTEAEYVAALVLATVLSVALLAVAWWWDRASVGLLVLQTAMALNVLAHLSAAVAVRAYVPGLWSAVLIQAPTAAVVFRGVHVRGWLSRAQWRLVFLAALALHGPGLWGLLAGVQAW